MICSSIFTDQLPGVTDVLSSFIQSPAPGDLGQLIWNNGIALMRWDKACLPPFFLRWRLMAWTTNMKRKDKRLIDEADHDGDDEAKNRKMFMEPWNEEPFDGQALSKLWPPVTP